MISAVCYWASGVFVGMIIAGTRGEQSKWLHLLRWMETQEKINRFYSEKLKTLEEKQGTQNDCI